MDTLFSVSVVPPPWTLTESRININPKGHSKQTHLLWRQISVFLSWTCIPKVEQIEVGSYVDITLSVCKPLLLFTFIRIHRPCTQNFASYYLFTQPLTLFTCPMIIRTMTFQTGAKYPPIARPGSEKRGNYFREKKKLTSFHGCFLDALPVR